MTDQLRQDGNLPALPVVARKCDACRETGAIHCSDPINCGSMREFADHAQAIALIAAERARADALHEQLLMIRAQQKDDYARADALEAALIEVLDANEEEAKTQLTLEKAQANYSKWGAEHRAATQAMIRASRAEKAARALLSGMEYQSNP